MEKQKIDRVLSAITVKMIAHISPANVGKAGASFVSQLLALEPATPAEIPIIICTITYGSILRSSFLVDIGMSIVCIVTALMFAMQML